MNKLNSRRMPTAVLAAALLAGCGGGGGGGVAFDSGADVGQSVMRTIAFINNLIANNSENSDPIDINPLTLAVDDSADPTPLN
ncbi:MAG: hypothetical protein ACREXV_02260 [Polaromonas sp.]